MGLDQNTCVPCRGGATPLTADEAGKLLQQTPGWELLDNVTKIRRTFKFDKFMPAMAFARKVGELAEKEGHHPDITFGWGYCTVLFYTHKIKGLHQNDFVMAAKVNALAG
ncbi:MAG: 4a-hydroxytetrahydrobiopterin dehydratase [Gammaproteobacteria bacterium]|nr:MAG: 4a-hydroxytetrahydrobiopterin dehydratase [Gammaproteobacteria bacterium]TND04068.1 MAG: 4a-hydroxytetrahydrobiopterin dehydratase [Gammaproteobacteria bacterium]